VEVITGQPQSVKVEVLQVGRSGGVAVSIADTVPVGLLVASVNLLLFHLSTNSVRKQFDSI
jgi:hypothetical protein